MTYVTDPIGDLLTRMRNAQAAGRSSCRVPRSCLKEELCQLLKKDDWIAGAEVTGEAPKQEIVVLFHVDRPRLLLRRISTPGRRVYKGIADIRPVLRGHGIAVISTSRGLLTDAEARKQKVGGEVLCTVA